MDTKSFHLRRASASEGILKGVSLKGEFHEPVQPVSEALLVGVAPTGEIRLKEQCAPEGLLKGGSPKGEFHGTIQPASQVLLAGLAPTGEMASEALLPRSEGPWGIELPRVIQAWQKFGQPGPLLQQKCQRVGTKQRGKNR